MSIALLHPTITVLITPIIAIFGHLGGFQVGDLYSFYILVHKFMNLQAGHPAVSGIAVCNEPSEKVRHPVWGARFFCLSESVGCPLFGSMLLTVPGVDEGAGRCALSVL